MEGVENSDVMSSRFYPGSEDWTTFTVVVRYGDGFVYKRRGLSFTAFKRVLAQLPEIVTTPMCAESVRELAQEEAEHDKVHPEE